MADSASFSLTVGYASDMGNAEWLAEMFGKAAAEAGLDTEVVELNSISLPALRATTHFVVISSTFGDGEVPYNGAVFWEALRADDAGRFDGLTMAVLALGDRGYDHFCNAGKIIDERLAELGATRLCARVDCDIDFEEPAAAWTAQVVAQLVAAGGTRVVAPAPAGAPPAPTVWDRNHPFEATVVVNHLMTEQDPDREVRHFEFDLAGSGIDYRAGDALAVHPVNDPELVEELLVRLGGDPDDAVAGHDEPLGMVLSRRLEISTPSPALRDLVAARTGGPGTDDMDVLDLLEIADLDADDVLPTLRRLRFRDYSIASSPLVHPDRVHLTVSVVRHAARGRRRGGVASTFLADRARTVGVHLRPNHTFRLPGPDVPIIMVGPGTRIAPFRAFLHERRVTGARGKTWLFFGNRRASTDFLYRTELQRFVDSRTLTRLDLAFSRDAAAGRKTYVQDRMRDNAAQLFAWLQDGAHLYVCGDAEPMARDVDRALHEIVAAAGGMDAAAAHAYVNELVRGHRYLRDVY